VSLTAVGKKNVKIPAVRDTPLNKQLILLRGYFFKKPSKRGGKAVVNYPNWNNKNHSLFKETPKQLDHNV
jgi:hypothetical protein